MDKDSLVQQIKQLQRSDPIKKQMWWDYCDTRLGAKRDPNFHDEAVLEEFLSCVACESYESGSSGFTVSGTIPRGTPIKGGKGKQTASIPPWLATGGSTATGGSMPMDGSIPSVGSMMGFNVLADFIKIGQRQSPAWKEAWREYCVVYGVGKFDPAMYPPKFINDFTEYVGTLVMRDLKGGGQQAPLEMVPPSRASGGKIPAMVAPQKRNADPNAFWPPAKRSQNNFADIDPEMAELVKSIKEFQRSSPESKELWGRYCDKNHKGNRDPARHDMASLQQFLDDYVC